MLVHPNFDPVAVQLGPLAIHWYGLMYVLGFLGVYLYWNHRIKAYPNSQSTKWNSERISDLVFYGALGAVLGGRLGYVLFYKPAYYLSNPLEIIFVNQGGMSFHGGLIGVLLVLYWFGRKMNLTFLQVGDFVGPAVPIGLFFGRMGNFINQELWGTATDVPWGMVFTTADELPRHPSMLYEAVLEGIILFALLYYFARKPRPVGFLSGWFLIGYALSRMLVELVRVPDAHLNYLLFDWVTMGHVLSLPMLLGGIFLLIRAGNSQ